MSARSPLRPGPRALPAPSGSSRRKHSSRWSGAGFQAARLLLLPAAFLFGACGGSVKANTSADASTKGGASTETNFDAEGDATWQMTEDTQSASQTSATAESSTPRGTSPKTSPALLGARHDLLLSSGATETCKCLATVLGTSSTPGFVWTGERPTLDASRQLVVALASDGIACPESTAGASYMGYAVKGGDVIVHVEAAVEGRPITYGAIIPRPAQGGQVYIEPVGKIPHGKGLDGQPRCALGAGPT